MTRIMPRRPRLITALPLLAIPLLGSCVAPDVVPAPVAMPVRTPVPLPPPPPVAQDWTDGPVTPGVWRYRTEAGGTVASYAAPSGVPLFALRCVSAGDVALLRPGAGAAITIVTTGPVRTLPADAAGAAHVSARDGFLDAIAFSRGRMLVQAPPLPAIVVPVQGEISRVIEDCRS